MTTPKRKLLTKELNPDSPKKSAPDADAVIHGKSSERRIPNEEQLKDTDWIRENHNVKTMLYFLEECVSILRIYNPILTGSAAILVYLITAYQSGNIERLEFESMLKSLKPINDIDAVFEGIVKTKDFKGFKPQLKKTNSQIPDVLLEADGISFVKESVPLDPQTGYSVDKPIKIEVIIAKLGKKRVHHAEDDIIDREIELPISKKINVRIYHPRILIRKYLVMDDEDGKRDDTAKITVLRRLLDTDLVTPEKSKPVSRFSGSSVRKLDI